MKQSRIDSLMEALTNVLIGFLINFFANWLILPWFFGIPADVASFAILGVIYTAISIARSYLLRRAFNGRSVWESMRESVRFCAAVTIILSPLIIVWQLARHAPQAASDLAGEYKDLFRSVWTGRR